MLASGMSQVAVAEALGVTDRTIRNWAKAKSFQNTLARARQPRTRRTASPPQRPLERPSAPAPAPKRQRPARSAHEQWLNTPKSLAAPVAFTHRLVPGHRANGQPYAAEAWQPEDLLAQGSTPDP